MGKRGDLTKEQPTFAKKPKMAQNVVFNEKNVKKERKNADEKNLEPGSDEKKKEKEQKKDVSLIIEKFSLDKSMEIWQFLDLRGPLPKSNCLTVELVKNRPFVELFREITGKIHENMVKFHDEMVKEFSERTDVPQFSEVSQIVQKLCSQTMEFDNIQFNVIGILKPIRVWFEKDKTQVDSKDFPEFLEQIRKILADRKMEIAETDLVHVRNELVRHLFLASIDLINWLFSLDVFINIIQIEGVQKLKVFYKEYLQTYSNFDALSTASFISKLFKSNHIARTTSSLSLWTSIPCEHDDNDHLLEHVFEWGLIRLLPGNVKWFFIKWMKEVRRKMRKRLRKGSLRRSFDAVFLGDHTENPLTVKTKSNTVRQFLEKVIGDVLNFQENFVIYDGDWMDLIMNFIQKPPKNTIDNNKMRVVVSGSEFETAATNYLKSLFPDKPGNMSLFLHTTLQLYRFLIYFCYSTLRHFFQSEDVDVLVFDGILDEQVTDFTEIDEYGNNKKHDETSSHVPLNRMPAMDEYGNFYFTTASSYYTPNSTSSFDTSGISKISGIFGNQSADEPKSEPLDSFDQPPIVDTLPVAGVTPTFNVFGTNPVQSIPSSIGNICPFQSGDQSSGLPSSSEVVNPFNVLPSFVRSEPQDWMEAYIILSERIDLINKRLENSP